jgi:hypothetical protein
MTQPPYGQYPPPQYPSSDQPVGWQQPPKPPFYKKPWVAVVGAVLGIGLIASAVNGGNKDDDTSTASATTSATALSSSAAPPPPTSEVAAPPPTTAAAPTTQAAPVGVSFAMPNFVGMDLQSAQNLVQENGVFLSRSHDLLGSRNQLVDSNWIVCDQNIPAGQQVTGDAEGLIDFGVVKREESCP